MNSRFEIEFIESDDEGFARQMTSDGSVDDELHRVSMLEACRLNGQGYIDLVTESGQFGTEEEILAQIQDGVDEVMVKLDGSPEAMRGFILALSEFVQLIGQDIERIARPGGAEFLYMGVSRMLWDFSQTDLCAEAKEVAK